MKKNGFLSGVLLFLFSALFFSCQSLQQDKNVSILYQEQSEEINAIELEIASLEVSYLLSELSYDSLVVKLDSSISSIDKLLSKNDIEREGQAKLVALKGKSLLLQGKKAPAKSMYDKACVLYKGEVNTVILSSRLSLSKEDVEKMKISSDLQGFLTLEKAISLYRSREYRKAAAKFDEAFMSIPLNYRQCYEKMRNSAWSLRESGSGNTFGTDAIVSKEKVTVGQMLLLAQNQGELMYRYTAAKNLNEAELFKRTFKAGLFEPSSNPAKTLPSSSVTKDSVLTRRLFARFAWNLKTELSSNKKDSTKYTVAFKGEKVSPVTDVPYEDEDFDAVLGCVENEILELPDAENFFPNNVLSGLSCSKALKKIR